MKPISYTPRSAKQLSKLPADIREALMRKLYVYAGTGESRAKALKGVHAARLCYGDYRIVFGETETEITVVAAGHRREAYR